MNQLSENALTPAYHQLIHKLAQSHKKLERPNKVHAHSISTDRRVMAEKQQPGLSVKRKADDKNTAFQRLVNKSCIVATPENQVAARQSPQPSGSGQASHSFELYLLTGFYIQTPQTYDQQPIESAPLIEKRKIREHQCTWPGCGKIMRGDKHDFEMHTRTHTGEKPYKCRVCDYVGSQRSSVNNHFKKNHSEEPQEGTRWVRAQQPSSTSATPPHTDRSTM